MRQGRWHRCCARVASSAIGRLQTPPAGTTQPEKENIQLMRDALLSLSGIMSEKKAVDSALVEARQKDDAPMLRTLAIYSFPLAMQTPLFLLIGATWALLVVALTRKSAA